MKKEIFVLMVGTALLVGVLSGCVEEEKDEKPKASFTIPENTDVNSEIQFTDTSTDDGTISEWFWEFGDGETSIEQNPKHTYSSTGSYTVNLTVTDDAEQTKTATKVIEITKMDIIETAVYAGFGTLATALTTADLIETLKGEGPFTVFAPTDDAFATLNQTWLTALLDDITNLTKVLTYHVISGKLMSTDLQAMEYMTLEGTNITIAIDGNNVTINEVDITTADVECSNGVIHIIGEVLLPESVEGP